LRSPRGDRAQRQVGAGGIAADGDARSVAIPAPRVLGRSSDREHHVVQRRRERMLRREAIVEDDG